MTCDETLLCSVDFENLHATSEAALAIEMKRDGAMGASTSMLGLNMHAGIDEILLTILVSPRGAHISRPALRINILNLHFDGQNLRADEPFVVDSGLTIRSDHYNARHLVWQPLIEPFHVESEVRVPLIPSSEEELLDEMNFTGKSAPLKDQDRYPVHLDRQDPLEPPVDNPRSSGFALSHSSSALHLLVIPDHWSRW